MDVMEAIYQRKSIRRFKSAPVSRAILTKILEAACRAPSALNSQPWKFIVLAGDAMERARTAIVGKFKRNEPMHPDHDVSVSWPDDSIYRTRQVDLAKKLFRLMDIRREDRESRLAWLERGFRFFDAPAAILILADRSLSDTGPLLDLGAAMQTLCLAAVNFGLGTCIEDQGATYPEVLREIAHIPEDKKIVIAVAIGYPDWDFPANALVSDRESLENNTRWVGF